MTYAVVILAVMVMVLLGALASAEMEVAKLRAERRDRIASHIDRVFADAKARTYIGKHDEPSTSSMRIR